MSDTILVTGGSGFIGSHVCLMLLERGHRVINFDMFPRRGPLAWLMQEYEKDILFEKGGVEHLTQLIAVVRTHKPDKIVHLAASIDLDSLERYPMQVYHSFVGGTVNVLEVMRLLGGVDRMVNFSSIGVLPTVRYQPLDCDHPTLMAAEGSSGGVYGAGKLGGEAFCWAYADLFNLDVVILRPSAAYGFFTTNPIFMNDMLEGALRGEKVRLPAGKSVPRDYTHVHDIAGITVAALYAPAARLQHRCFYAASGMNPLVTGGQVADIVRDMVPDADIDIADVMTPMMERYDLKCRGVHDMKPVEDQLGYQIKYRDVRAGMQEYADRYCEYLIAQGEDPGQARVNVTILDKFRLDGKVAIVTGASTGLGQGMAIGLAEAGADVVGVGSRRSFYQTQSAIEKLGRRFVAVKADLAELDSVPVIVNTTLDRLGRLDILVNNAAGQRRKGALEFTEEDWDYVHNVNLKTVYFLCKAAAQEMLKQGGGKIINVCSVLSFQGGYGVLAYTASKGGVAQLTKALSTELAPRSINVNGIAPGYFATELNQPLLDDPVRLPQINARIPAGRWGTPEDLKGAAVYLASAASDYMHGHILVLDGGWMSR